MRNIIDLHHFRYQHHSDDSRRPFSRRALKVISANVEGLFNSKEQLLATICKNQNCDVLRLQETHRGTTNHRSRVHGLTLAVEHPHSIYGSAIFVKTGTIVESTSVTDDSDVEVLELELKGVTVPLVYKPLVGAFRMHTLRTSKPQAVIGDFNSHSINWKYNESNLDEDAVEAWAKASQLSLVHNAKLPKSFNTGLWKRGYNPDIAFVSHCIASLSKKLVLEPLLRSQHRLIGITVTLAVSTASVPNRRRFNLKKANW